MRQGCPISFFLFVLFVEMLVILINNDFYLTSVFNKSSFKYNILSLLDMMDNHGDILSYNDFCQKHGFVCHPKEF